MRNRKNSFESLFSKIDWVMIESKRTWRLSSDHVAIGFYPKDKKKPDVINDVRIRIGVNVMEKLNWNYGDKICVLHDPDDLMSFYLTRSDTGKGFSLGKEAESGTGRIQFKWDRDIAIEQINSHAVKFHIHKGGLVIFRVGNQEEDEDL